MEKSLESLGFLRTAMFMVASVTTAIVPITGQAQSSIEDGPSFSHVVSRLTEASIPVRQLHGKGSVAVTLAAGRVVALAFSDDGANLLWSNPQLDDTEIVKATPTKLVGGFGGDRIWFSPELQYHWLGKPNWRTIVDYKVPEDTDPGRYRFLDEGSNVISLKAEGRLPVRGTDHYVDFRVDRRVRMTNSPLPFDDLLMRGIDYVGIETTHHLNIGDDTPSGQLDLWHLLQVPTGSVMIIPLRPGHKTQVLSYGLPGPWEVRDDSVTYPVTGDANSKIGIASEALTGRSAVVRRLGQQRWCLLIRQFPVEVAARYGDHPYGIPRSDQVFQAWDGQGFGEMEYHSPVLDAKEGPRALHDQDEIWAFGGDEKRIAALAKNLLNVEIGAVMESMQSKNNPPHSP